jgi:hypothetical protein
LSKGVSVVLRLFLFKGGKVLEVFWGYFGYRSALGFSGQNRPDRFAKPVGPVSPSCWEAKFHRVGLTSFRNRSDRFWFPAPGSCCFPLCVLSGCCLCLAPRSSSTPGAAWTWQ